MQPPDRPLHFGQHERQELRVEPSHGIVGTQFRFQAIHFAPRKRVNVVVKGPEERIHCDRFLETDDDGSIGNRLILTASSDWLPGIYTFLVDGLPTTFTLK